MVTCICLSPCIDKTVSIPKFTYGGMNRAKSIRTDPSGKGFNVARVLSRFGVKTVVQGFLFHENSELITKALEEDGVINDCCRLPGAVRTNTKILDEENHIITEINEPNPAVDAESMRKFEDKLREAAKRSEYVCFSGSLPAGFPPDTYERLMNAVSDTGSRCILDAEGDALKAGLRANPYLVKPNKYELELFEGRPLNSSEEIRLAACRLASGASVVLVSLGKDGALITDGKRGFIAEAVDVDVKSTVGAGDSMVAGAVYALMEGMGIKTALKYGVAAAASCVSCEGTGLANAETAKKLIKQVKVTEISNLL